MQGELFQVGGSTVENRVAPTAQEGRMDRFRVTLRLEHMSIGGILALVFYVLVFSFGVEKGKRFALEELRAEKTKQEQITQELEQTTALPAAGVSGLAVLAPAAAGALETHSLSAPSNLTETNNSMRLNTSGKFTIQLITFTSRPRAEKEVERLKKTGHQSFIIPTGKFFQICVDAFETQAEARTRLTRLKAEGLASTDAFIRPNKGGMAL